MTDEQVDFGLSSVDQLDSLVQIVRAIREVGASTKPELGRLTGLGRSVVTQRVDQAIRLGLIIEGELAHSTGGRAPRLLQFDANAGQILVAVFGATHVSIGVADLAGAVSSARRTAWDITVGPVATIEFLVDEFAKALADSFDAPVWGIAVGVPGPVEFRTGRPVAPPIMPGWDDFDIRSILEARFDAPVWVDNDVNLMAVGEYTDAERAARRDMIYVKIGTGIGAGIISEGHVHRGLNGSAGDVGHILVPDHRSQVCRCGRLGCLEAVAGGWAITRDATARASESRFLTERLASGALTTDDVVRGSLSGDVVCLELIIASGRALGEHIAAMVNFFNPSRIAIGGSVASAGDRFMATILEIVYQRSLPLATRGLQVGPAMPDEFEGLRGAATLVTDQLFDASALGSWVLDGRPGSPRGALYGHAAA